MNKNELPSTVIGAASSVSIGSVLMDSAGALLIGVLGALGGWLFAHFVKPKLDKWFKK
jgi:hypothetical protein